MITRDDVLDAEKRISKHINARPCSAAARPPRRCGSSASSCSTPAFSRPGEPSTASSLHWSVASWTRRRHRRGIRRQRRPGQRVRCGPLGVPATVFVPETAPRVKVERLREYGAPSAGRRRVRRGLRRPPGVRRADRRPVLPRLRPARDRGRRRHHRRGDPPGRARHRHDRRRRRRRRPVRGDGRGRSGRAKIVAVEPVTIPTLHAALEAGRPVDVSVSGIAADSLGRPPCRRHRLRAGLEAPPVSVLVDDEAIIAARTLVERLPHGRRTRRRGGLAASPPAPTFPAKRTCGRPPLRRQHRSLHARLNLHPLTGVRRTP